MAFIEADVKPGEKIISNVEILRVDDVVFNPITRPPLEAAITLILGTQSGYKIPFAAVPFAHHQNIAEQNLFRCLFGRDALLVADLLQKVHPEIQENVVLALASVQGTKMDPLSEEEPGRIPHEVREIDDPRAIELRTSGQWKFPYYGAVDATLIWLCALARISAINPNFLDQEIAGLPLWQRAISATKWVLLRLQTPSGFIESNRSNPQGIQNQVWKDSGDSYMHADGTLAIGNSTASIETVAEAFDALHAVVQIMGQRPSIDWPGSTSEILERAEVLRINLINQMWLGDRFALGTERDLSGVQQAFDSQASNQGRLLDSNILVGDQFLSYRQAIVRSLVGPGLLGETGLRTLSKDHPAYRPGGYHTGSAWPMDGVFASRGLIRHGFDLEARKISKHIKNAIESFGGYPEYFRGDYPEHLLISTSQIDVIRYLPNGKEFINRVVQPPQIMQGWTIGAYAWLSENS
jgi:glycogen debranching enzyme